MICTYTRTIHGAPSCSLRSSQGFIVDQQKPAHIPDDIPAFAVAIN